MGRLETADDLLRQAHLIEEAAQDAYLALISQIHTNDYRLAAGFILVDEVRHLTVWKRVLGLRTY
jgi:rubrerythrin